ncbi:MAG: HAMP domain-containing protein [Syntrophobacterales bacterium]|nr:HAMP domain-containing protein [Syntrophobacterales bacterium]
MHLNIRQKVIVIFAAAIVVIGLIASYSYYYLKVIEVKQHIVEMANDLREIILEIRRYEKNFLLYHSPQDLQENLHQIELASDTLRQFYPEGKILKISQFLGQLETELNNYRKLMQKFVSGTAKVSSAEEEEMRERGKKLVELSRELVIFERQRILEIITNLKAQLITAVIFFIFCGIFLTVLISRKILRPLKVIENTTLRIAKGDFRPLPVLQTRDETQQVVEAFNRMVTELSRRQHQLVESKKMSSLGILTAGIAHQLNNPLNNISTSCQILLEELESGPPELLRKMLHNIQQEVIRARDIVKGLLEFSRVRDFSLHRVPLAQVVKRSLQLISSQVPSHIDIVNEVPDDLVAEIDPQRLQEVFLNLIMNAIQAIPQGPGRITLKAEADPNRGQVVITVSDNGVGIPPEALDQIFDPFFTLKEEGVGTGLGLSIVYGIIEKHRGSIEVESRVGEGTTFTIRLPLPEAQGEEPRE